ncbi:hypothetical protein IJG89_03465 [Candidatus Saccharibacteria bacterium]|nr:hypothetical protein [Candidatus Saccharibacteria bacterium]
MENINQMKYFSMPKHLKSYKITYNLNELDPPKSHKLNAANLIANYFESNLVFIRKAPCATPDLYIVKTHQLWELKSPLGNGKRTISNNLREASSQSKNVILDLSRCKMNNERALSKVQGFINSGDAHIKKLIVIKKSGEVVDFLLQKR